MSNRAIRILYIKLLGIILVGCSSTSNGEIERDSNVEHLTSHEPIIVEDYGRELISTEKPTKVLTLGPSATELFIGLGLEDFVSGKSLDNRSRAPLTENAEAYAN